MTPTERLEELRSIGRGLLDEAMTRPVEGTHGGDEMARYAAIGRKATSILNAWERLHAQYAEFLREQVKSAKEKK